MREIKFRAWDKKYRNMFYDFQHFILHDLVNEPLEATVYWRDGCLVTHCELMQYTGLKDKNGVEIYEGDIVKGLSVLSNLLIGVIEYEAPFYWAVARGERAFSVGDKCEVLGNIYSHKELLEG